MTTGVLRVLITNYALEERAGTELYVRDLATGLLRRGHAPVVYTTRAGEAAAALRRETVPVVTDLRQLGSPPDIIHGQHHAETMTALLHFPSTPALFVCHGWLAWEETPPRFPRVLRYVAVDETCRDRLVCEHGVPEPLVRVAHNFVDLERFRPRGPLPPKPRRALVFSNHAGEATHLGAVREACARAGVELDVAGLKSGRPCAEPEKILGSYDLVFAKARCALEAMAVGAAVVLCDAAGAGPLVTSAELARLRGLNFGIRALREVPSPDALAREIARYDAADAAEVSRRVRAVAGRDRAVDEMVTLYREVIDESRAVKTCDAGEEGRAAADYVRWLTTELAREREGLKRERDLFTNSVTARLRERVLSIPLLGPIARAASNRLAH